jgi:hypothetical protein
LQKTRGRSVGKAELGVGTSDGLCGYFNTLVLVGENQARGSHIFPQKFHKVLMLQFAWLDINFRLANQAR